jgi:hypothetical protein
MPTSYSVRYKYALRFLCKTFLYTFNDSGDHEQVRRTDFDILKYAIFSDLAPCSSYVNSRFGGTYRLHLQGRTLTEQGTHGTISQKNVTLSDTAVGTSYPVYTDRNLFSAKMKAYVALSRIRSLDPLIVVSGTNESLTVFKLIYKK